MRDRFLLKALLERAAAESNMSFEITLSNGQSYRFGDGQPQFTVRSHRDAALLSRMPTEFSLGRAYVEGQFDVHGDMLSLLQLRQYLKGRGNVPILLKFLYHLFSRSAEYVNRRAVTAHYTLGDEFYLSFVDQAYRFYSHCLFQSSDDTLEQAAERKLETMYADLRLRPGMRLLDIGAGWGGVHEYCGPRGVSVTSVTLTQDSFNYTNALIERMGLKHCTVRLEDFLLHKPDERYDAVVIYGVIEHIPYYRQFCRRLWHCLKPGGLLYLDASATLEKYSMNDFTRYYIWQGTHTFLCLQDLIQELLYHGLEVVKVQRETRDYELTMKHWAMRFDENESFITERWGQEIFRSFRLFLWAGCHAFRVNRLQAYHLVARRRGDAGPRPGLLRRATAFIRSLI